MVKRKEWCGIIVLIIIGSILITQCNIIALYTVSSTAPDPVFGSTPAGRTFESRSDYIDLTLTSGIKMKAYNQKAWGGVEIFR
jgi:hypothetical protein